MSKVKLLKPIERPLPTEEPDRYKVRKFGVVGPNDHQIFIRKAILKEITQYSKTNLHRELGGVLIGGYYQWMGRPFVEIDAYIPARLGESRSASFKFTHDSWHEIQIVREDKYPDRPLVGWHHTHPSFGVFLSGMDLFIHKGYFDLPWQVALVVDPCADKLGFFQWRGEQIVTVGFQVVTPVEG
jgi:proteasome lid subunit RPN8/RPN11